MRLVSEGRVQSFLSFLSGDLLVLAFDAITQPKNEQAPGKPGQHVPKKGVNHGRVHSGVGVSAKDWSGMLGAPPAV